MQFIDISTRNDLTYSTFTIQQSHHYIKPTIRLGNNINKALKLTRIYSICIWCIMYRSQDRNILDSNVLTVVWMKSPKWRVAQSYIADQNIPWPHDLNKGTPCVVQKFLAKFLPPCLTLSIYGTIIPCKSWHIHNQKSQMVEASTSLCWDSQARINKKVTK